MFCNRHIRCQQAFNEILDRLNEPSLVRRGRKEPLNKCRYSLNELKRNFNLVKWREHSYHENPFR